MVPRCVSVGVIDLFEVIEIQKTQYVFPFAAMHVGQYPDETPLEFTTIDEAGQWIMTGSVGQAPELPIEFADVSKCSGQLFSDTQLGCCSAIIIS